MKYPKYSEYKDSGVEWIGQIPVTWSTKKLKYIIQNFIGGGTPSTDNNDYWTSEGGFPWVTIRDITKSDAIRETERKITASGLNSKNLTLLPPGTILYSMYASVGKVSKLLITATTNQAILGLFNRENQVLNDYLKFSLEAFESFVSFLFSSNTQNNINEEKVKNIILPLPPISEQASISKVLFAEIDLINNVISRSQEMIELLKEKRQAIITNAVTKGLDPNVPMKDSGIEWIGQIPEHWKIIRIKSVSKLNPSKSEIKDYTDDTKVPFFPMESIGDDGYLRFTEFRSIYEVIKGYTHFRNGDVVVAKITPCFENGKGAIIKGLEPDAGFGSTELMVIRPSSVLNKSFLYFLTITNFFRNLGEASMQGSAGQKRITEAFIANFKIGLPPLDEQIHIVQHVISEINKIDLLVLKQQKIIEFLKEYKTSLITQAVTGKIDVRGFTPPTASSDSLH